MIAFPGSPRVVKGALVGVDLFKPLASMVIFQYNPEMVTRTLQAQASRDGGARSSLKGGAGQGAGYVPFLPVPGWFPGAPMAGPGSR
jgi:hypothetical protein